jgi:ribosomal protein S18 acetylase RimI-like enzyme
LRTKPYKLDVIVDAPGADVCKVRDDNMLDPPGYRLRMPLARPAKNEGGAEVTMGLYFDARPMNSEFTLRRSRSGDETALVLLGTATVLETYAGLVEWTDILAFVEAEHVIGVYKNWFASGSADIWIAETATGHSAVGYIVALTTQGADSPAKMEIKHFYVFHRFHGSGLGRLLMDEALATARRNGVAELFLKVLKQNYTAINFYSRAGFRVATEEPLRIGENGSVLDLVVMRLIL